MTTPAEKRKQQIEAKLPHKSNLENNLLSIKSIMEMDFPNNAWLMEKLVPLQGITIISGAPGSYKTFLMWQMAINIAEGTKFLEKFQCSQSAILIIDEENHLRLVKDRLKMLGADFDLPIHFLPQQDFAALNEASVKEVIRICEDNSINTILIDSLVRISNVDENDAQQMAKVFKAIKHFCQAGKTVIITHHERKEGANKGPAQARLRGSSDIPAAVDCHISVRKSKDNNKVIIVEQPKLRMDEEMEPFTISVISEEGSVEFRCDGAPISEKDNEIKDLIIEILGEDENIIGLSMKDVVEKVRKNITVSEQAIKKMLKELIEKGIVDTRSGEKNKKICFLAANTPDEPAELF